MISSKDITFVVQGNLRKEIHDCIKSIRTFFPESHIIFSTWVGTDISGIDCDEAVFSIDPGDNGDVFYPNNPHGWSHKNNLNRQIISSFNGMKKVKTPYAIKFRSDFILKSDAILKKYNEYLKSPDIRNKKWCMFNHKIMMFSPVNPNTTKLAYHLCDYFQMGHTEDLIEFWKIPLQSFEDAQYCVNNKINHPQKHRAYRYACEQELWLRNLDKFKIEYKKPEIYYDVSDEIIENSNQTFLNNLYFLDYFDADVSSQFNWLNNKSNQWAYKESDYQLWINKEYIRENKMKEIKTAVILYGFMRTYYTTASSLIKNVLAPNNADLFICSYDIEGESSAANVMDINRYKIQAAAKEDNKGNPVTSDTLKQVYGLYLKAYVINKNEQRKYIEASQNFYHTDYPLYRFFSLYDNISQACKLLNNYVKKTKIKYDAVILARPDLAFYSKIDVRSLDLAQLNIAQYGGNIKFTEPNELYYITGYRNIERSEYIPWHDVPFSDQLIISSYDNMKCLESLYSNLSAYESYGVPVCHPETCVYYHLGYRQNLTVKTNRILYEIIRNNTLPIDNTFLKIQQTTVTTTKANSSYWKYKILRKIFWGKKRRKYNEKYNEIKRIRKINGAMK